MNLENCTTIVAPSALHLPLYEQIFAQKGDCLHLRVISLEAWLQQQTEGARVPLIAILYEYARLLENLNPENVFYESRRDYDFLKACLDFIPLMKMYSLEAKDIDARTEREKSLKEVLEKLLPVRLWQQEAIALPKKDLSDTAILACEYSFEEQFWIDRMKGQGAREIGLPSNVSSLYWSAANPRKMMEVCADAIVEGQLDAQSVMAALADPGLKRVFCQVFDSRSIPYTFLHDETHTRVIDQWKAMFGWVKDKDQKALETLIEALWPEAGANLLRYWKLMPRQSHLASMEYEENPLLSREDFVSLQALELEASQWKPLLSELESYSLDSIETMGKKIQEANPRPDEEDIQAFEGVLNLWNALRDWIKEPQDLELLIRHLDTMHPSRALPSMEGVIVGSRKDISALRPNVFYLGADAKTFPGTAAKSGIFDEAFLALLPLPSLDERLFLHQANAARALSLPENLTIITPQADYEGKSIEPSHELTIRYGKLPVFHKSADSSVQIKPGFDLKPDEGMNLFVQDGTLLRTRVRALHTFDTCPLKNLLRYGMHIYTAYRNGESLQVNDRKLFEMVLAAASERWNLPFYSLSKDQIAQVCRECFSFARLVLPHEQARIDRLEQESIHKLQSTAANLAPAAAWNVSLVCADDPVSLQESAQGMDVLVEGSYNTSSSSRKATLTLLDPSQLVKDNGTGFFASGAKAVLNFDLQPAAKTYQPYKISYGRGSTPVSALPISIEETRTAALKDFFGKSMQAQDLGVLTDPIGEYVCKKVDTYQKRSEDTLDQAREYARSVKESRFLPEHKADACQRCPYRTICRNAAFEKEDKKRSRKTEKKGEDNA